MTHSEGLYIDYGTTRIPFLLVYSNRKTLGISVLPNRQVIITAPFNASLEKILQRVGKRARWISKQIRNFESYDENLLHRKLEYVSGETFYFLGRKYRLKVYEGTEEGVELYGRYLRVILNKKTDDRIGSLVMRWYKEQAKNIFHERFQRHGYILKRQKISVNQLIIRRMEKRWGSCTENGNIILNLSLVQANVQCIDYVLVHEICHLKYLNHGAKFYSLLSRYLEDWEKRRSRLKTVSLLPNI